MKKLLAALMLVGMLMSALALPAAAALGSDNGKSYTYSDCFTGYSGDTHCFTTKGEHNSVTTPSGNVMYQGNGTYSATTTDPSGTVVSSYGGRYHAHLSEGQSHTVYSSRARGTSTTPFSDCTFSYAFHAARGQVQFARYTFNCD